MEISNETHKSSCDFSCNSHGHGCKFRRSSRRRMTGGARWRLKCDGSGHLESPVVQWKLNVGATAGAPPVGGGGRIRRMRGGIMVGRSARKLAAGLWHLAAVRKSTIGDAGGGMTWHWQHRRFDQSIQFGLESSSSLPIPKTAMEGATTKRDHACPSRSPIEVCQFHSHARLLRNQQVKTISVAYALQVELLKARNRVKELETERHLFKKKLKRFLRGLSQEKASWIRRERKKMFLIIDGLKGEVERERRNYLKMEIVNSKLLSDLADAKLSTKRFKQECEKEKKTRELLEDVCHELGKGIEEYKAKAKAMKIECSRIQEEVEEERKMMQIAEVWREERVHMKLVDAKLILEEKYFQMNNLIAELETFLRSQGTSTPDAIKIKETEDVSMAMDSVTIQDIKELCYTPPRDDMMCTSTTMDNFQDAGRIETGIDECQSRVSAKEPSKFHNVSPESNESTKKFLYADLHHSIRHDNSSGNARFWETMNCTVGDDACSADRVNGGRHIPSASVGKDENANQEFLNPNSTDNISSGQKLKKKGRKIWKSTVSVGNVPKTIPIDENGRILNGSNSSIMAVSPEKVPEEALNHNNKLVSPWYLPGQRNPHIARAMKGCIEWPRGIQRHGLKPKLLEASFESQKTQLLNVPKQEYLVNK